MPNEKAKKPLDENAPEYLKFEANFRPGEDLTPAKIKEMLAGMREDLSKKTEKKSLDKGLERLLKGDVGATEIVAKNHEPLAFLVAAGHLLEKLEKAGVTLESEKPMGAQISALSTDPKFRTLAEQSVMDPLFRKGLHLAAEMTKDAQTHAHTAASAPIDALDAHLNTMLMERTLRTPDAEQLQNLQRELEKQHRGRETLSILLKNQEQQRTLAKMMFMGHLAGVQVSKGSEKAPFERSMGDLFAHGGRLVVNLPAGSLQSQQFDAVLGSNLGDAAGVYGRVFATHSVENALVNGNGSLKRASREYKPYCTDVHKNYGMDLSVGGIGCTGVDGSAITPNGENGHAYMKLVAGDDGKCGAMLFGVESSAPGKSSQLGQAHDGKAVKSKQSPFLSHKQQAGDLYSGRTIDFSQMDGQTFINLMDRFDAYYRDLQNDPTRGEELASLNKELCGRPMQQERVIDLLTNKLNLEAEQAKNVYGQLREEFVVREKRVQVAAPEKAPERPNIFKRWLARFNQSWREQNERYEQYVREQRTVRLRQRSALEDATSAVPAKWAEGTKTTLRDFVDKYKEIAISAESGFDRPATFAVIVQAVKFAAGASVGNKAAKLPDAEISTETLDVEQAMRDPVTRFLWNNARETMLKAMQSQEPCEAILQQTAKAARLFAVDQRDVQSKQTELKGLYDAMNVTDLESRSPEYQEMVAAVGMLALRENPSALDRMRVFNSVQYYVDKKSDVPSTRLGRESLDLAYKALKAALPGGRQGEELMKPFQEKMEKLHQAMHPGLPAAAPLTPQ